MSTIILLRNLKWTFLVRQEPLSIVDCVYFITPPPPLGSVECECPCLSLLYNDGCFQYHQNNWPHVTPCPPLSPPAIWPPALSFSMKLSNTPFAAVTLSALYQVASDDGLCNSPYNLQRHPARTKAFDGVYSWVADWLYWSSDNRRAVEAEGQRETERSDKCLKDSKGW